MRLLRFLVRQESQVANTLPVEVAEKQDNRRFWRQLEQYFESILKEWRRQGKEEFRLQIYFVDQSGAI